MFKIKLKYNGIKKPIVCTKTLTLHNPADGCVIYDGTEYQFIRGGCRIPTIEGYVPFVITDIIRFYHSAATRYKYFFRATEMPSKVVEYDYNVNYQFYNNRKLYRIANLVWCNAVGDYGTYAAENKIITFTSINNVSRILSVKTLYRNAIKTHKQKCYVRLYNVVSRRQLLRVLWYLSSYPKYIKIKILGFIWNIFKIIVIT